MSREMISGGLSLLIFFLLIAFIVYMVQKMKVSMKRQEKAVLDQQKGIARVEESLELAKQSLEGQKRIIQLLEKIAEK